MPAAPSPHEIEPSRSRPAQRVSFQKETTWYEPGKGLRERSTSRTRWWNRIISADPDPDDDDNDGNAKPLAVRISQWVPDASMSAFTRLLYHLVAFIISLVGIIFAIVAWPFQMAMRLHLLYVFCVLSPFVSFWMGSRWPQTPTIVWTSPETSWDASRVDLHILASEMFGILEEWRSAEREIGLIVTAGERSYERVSAAHHQLLDRFEAIEAGMIDGGQVASDGKGTAAELDAARELWKEIGGLKDVLESARRTFIDTAIKYEDALDRFIALESRVGDVELEIRGVVAKQERSDASIPTLVGSLIADATTDYEEARHRLIALETRVEGVVGEIRDVALAGQHTSEEGMSPLIENLIAEATTNYEEARRRLIALETRVEGVVDEIRDVALAGQRASDESVSPLIENLIAEATANYEEARHRLIALETRVEGVVDEFKDVAVQHVSDEGVSSLIGSLIEEAMAKEHTGKADYALHSAGAGILVTLTSPTKEIWPENMRDRFLGLTVNRGFAAGSEPEEALRPDLHAGRCWPFDGGKGSLGVALAQRIYVEEITVHHISREATVHDVSSAPKGMEFWGLVEGREHSAKVKNLMQSGANIMSGEDYPNIFGAECESYIRLSAFIYDITIGKEAQTFPVDSDIADLHIDFGVVVLMITSNWGGDYTCLYRLGVHGRRPIVDPEIVPLA